MCVCVCVCVLQQETKRVAEMGEGAPELYWWKWRLAVPQFDHMFVLFVFLASETSGYSHMAAS
jgi:hypothetical protein